MLVRSSVVMWKLGGLRAFTRGQLDLRLVVVRWCDRSAGGRKGVVVVGITVGRVRAECQRSCWGIYYVRHLSGCFV